MLQVISSSPGDLEPVFATMLENAVAHLRRQLRKYLSAGMAMHLHLVATHNTPPAFAEAQSDALYPPDQMASLRSHGGDAKTVVHVADLAADAAYMRA